MGSRLPRSNCAVHLQILRHGTYAHARAHILQKKHKARGFRCEAHATLAQCKKLKNRDMLARCEAQWVCAIEALWESCQAYSLTLARRMADEVSSAARAPKTLYMAHVQALETLTMKLLHLARAQALETLTMKPLHFAHIPTFKTSVRKNKF